MEETRLGSENAAGTRTVNIGNDGSGHGNILIRNSSGTTTNYISGSGNSYFKAGNVGIGTNNPVKRLHISASDQSLARIRISNTNTGSGGDNIDLIAGINNVGQDGFSIFNATSNQTQFVIQGGGNVGIGTTSPGAKLHVLQPGNGTSNLIITEDNARKIKIGRDSIQCTDLSDSGTNLYLNQGGGNVSVPNSGLVVGATGNTYKFEVHSGATNVTSMFKSTDNQAWISIQDDDSGTYGALIGIDSDESENFVVANASVTKMLSLNSSGSLKLHNYNSTNKTGTPTYILGTDDSGNVVKVLGGNIPGVPGGSGTLNTIPLWTPDGDTLGNSHITQNTNDIFIPRYLGHTGDGNNYIGFPANDVFNITTAGVQRFRVNADGNIGIGTTTPGAQFNVQGTSTIGWSNLANARILAGSVNSGIGIDSNEIVSKGENLYIGTITSGTDVIMRAGGATSRLQISGTNGNVGIGTTSPSEKLTVAGNVESQNTIILNYNNAGNKWQQLFDGSNGWNLRYNNGSSWSSNYINVNTSGNATFAGDITLGANHIGRDEDNYIGFETDNLIKLRVAGATQLKISDGVFTAQTDSDVDLGSSGTRFKELWVDSINGGSVVPGSYLPLAGGTLTGNLIVDGASITIDTDTAGNSLVWKESDSTTVAGQLRGYANRGDIYLYSAGTKTTELSASNDSFIPALHIGGTAAATGGVLQTTGNVNIDGSADISATVTATTFLGDLNGTINTATTGVTQVNSVDNTTIATTAYVNNKIALIPAGLVFQGTWNASTNTPTLTSGSGTTGNFYIVSVAGSTNLDGITDWKVGDWAVFIEQGASDQWEKIDNSSVLDGFGTGQSVTKWDGSGTSNTLTNGPITFSSNDSTFAGRVDAPTMSIADTGTLDSSVKLRVAGNLQLGSDNSGGAITKIYESSGLNLDSGNASRNIYFRINGTEKLKIDTSGNAIFAGTGEFAGAIRITETATAQHILIGNQDSGGTNKPGMIRSSNASLQFGYGNSWSGEGGTMTTSLTIGSDSNATFAGKIIAGQGVQFTGGTIASATTVLHTNNVVYARGGSGGMFLQNADGSDGIFIANDHVRFDAGSSERMRIIANGNVGIGTTSPVAKLHVEGNKSYSLGYLDATSDLHIGNDTMNSAVGAYSGSITFGSTNESNLQAASIVAVQTDTDPNEIGLAFFTQHSSAGSTDLVESMRIKNDGNVGIGETSPDGKLHVHQTGSGTLTTIITEDDARKIFIGRDAINCKDLSNNAALLYLNQAGGNVSISNNLGIGATSPSEKLEVVGNIKITAALLSNQDNTDVDTGTETVANVAIATYTAAFFDFVIKKTTNVRSGTVYACHDGTNVEFTETSTQDLGDTSDVTLSVDISGGNMRLRATTTSDNWSIKSLIRAI